MFAFLKPTKHGAEVYGVLNSLACLSFVVDCCKPGAGRQAFLRQPGGNCTSMIEPLFLGASTALCRVRLQLFWVV